ncbi:hypothetical protein PLESTB_000966100 [Pleodorina starrii]|uniref:Uncharacterized protein n=1 Tax=Pleodorina starrii TaxID=330485 RepID=A0A9W6BPQ3_9CHLO|nr:hypothetical protein PLESTB_000966100 [Pleodorina starrii]
MDASQAEREAREKATRERLQKRANIIVSILRKFMVEWNAAYMKELEEKRAAAAAKAALKGKRRRKVKAKPDANNKDKKKSKKPKSRMAEVWSLLFSSIDELINKAKRINLEDLYRGAELLAPPELVQLRNILYTANKKVLPKAMNVNQINIKTSLWAAAAAHEYSAVDRTLLYPVPALAVMRDKGLGAKHLQDLGYRERELLRVGFNASDACEVAPHEPARLRAAGLSVSELVAGFGGLMRLPPDLQGFRGIQKLRAAGYSAADMVAGGLDNAWDLARAGFSAAEVYSAGVPAEALRPAGFGLPELRPPGFLGPSLAVLQETDPRLLPPSLEGTRGGIWPRLLQPQAAPGKEHSRSTSAFRFGNRSRPTTAAANANGAPTALSPSSTTSGYVSLRQVAWPDTPGGGGGVAGVPSATVGALPPAPAMSRAASIMSTA